MKSNTLVKVYESGGGAITAMVFTEGEISNIISGFEDRAMTKEEFITAAQGGFEWADEYDPYDFSGLDMKVAACEIMKEDDLIAEINSEKVKLYENNMGEAGVQLFDLIDEEARMEELGDEIAYCLTHGRKINVQLISEWNELAKE